MTFLFEGIQCPIIETKLKEGGKLEIFSSRGSILSRIEYNGNLIASTLADSICLLIQKTEWQLKSDKLCYRHPFKRTTGDSPLDTFVKKGGKITIQRKYSQLEGILISSDDRIVTTRQLRPLSSLIGALEIDAIQCI